MSFSLQLIFSNSDLYFRTPIDFEKKLSRKDKLGNYSIRHVDDNMWTANFGAPSCVEPMYANDVYVEGLSGQKNSPRGSARVGSGHWAAMCNLCVRSWRDNDDDWTLGGRRRSGEAHDRRPQQLHHG